MPGWAHRSFPEGHQLKKIAKIENFDTRALLTVPNLLSAYRLVTFPFLLALAILGLERIFSVLLVVDLVTDSLDGLIARLFRAQTAIGARLDSLADIGMYVLALLGIILFKWSVIRPTAPAFLVFLSLSSLTVIIAFAKFGRFHSFHLYSARIGGYMQGVFFFLLFTGIFIPWFFYLTIIFGCCAFVENIIIPIIIPRMRSNLKGLYWVLKQRGEQ